MNQYRLLYFEPCPGVKWNIPVAAVLIDKSQAISVAVADLLPTPESLPSIGHYSVMKYVVDDFVKNPVYYSVEFKQRPYGDMFFLSSFSYTDQDIEWLKRCCLPSRKE